MGKGRRTVKRGKYTSVDDLSSNIFNDLEGEARLSALVDEAEEVLSQRAIAQAMHPEVRLDALIDGTSQTAEQQIARRMIFGDGEVGTLPPDMFRGSDLRVKQLGVDGQIKPTSGVIGGTTGGMVGVGEDAVLDVRRNGVLTEYLSPAEEEKLYRSWQEAHPGQDRKNFNADISEYMGQQMLRTVGAQPVADSDRSDKVRQGVRMDYSTGRGRIQPLPSSQSTQGTDRLVENSVGLSAPDIDLSGDLRYMMDGSVRVGDQQTGQPRDTVRLNLLKAASGPGTSTRALQENWGNAAGRMASVGSTPTASKIIQALVAQGKLPPIKQASAGRGIRAGKAMSSDPMFRHQNRESQFRYDDILYAHTDEDLRSKPRGYIPSDVVLVDARKAGDAIGVMPSDIIYSHMGSVNATPKINDLIAAGAASRLTDDPRIKQMLP